LSCLPFLILGFTLGPEDQSRLLLLSSGAWEHELHEEIWVYDQSWWSKDHALWSEIQKANWKEVILKDDFKKAIQKDVYGFFASEQIYKDLEIPWKVCSLLFCVNALLKHP
jgi:transitional endoplasmic reticulum ATPase